MLSNKNIEFKLWVLKFCIKIIYPKFNYFMFMVFIGIKYNITCHKNNRLRHNTDMLKLCSNSAHAQRLRMKECGRDNLSILWHKCLIIPREQFIDLVGENIFYYDKGVLWITMKLSPQTKKVAKQKLNENNKHKISSKFLKYNLNFLTSDIHKEIFKEDSNSLEKLRVIPIFGAREVSDNFCSATEVEYHNIISSYGILNLNNVEISLHPIMKMDHAPKIASAAEVSHIVNDYDLDNDFLKEILSNHFETPKLVHVHDIFYIDLLPKTTSKYHYKYLDLVENIGRLYFKCQKLEHSENIKSRNIEVPYFIVKGVTQLTLGENIHILKPEDRYFHSNNSTTRSKSSIMACPTGLRDKFNVIQETIEPFLSGRTSELLSSLPSPVIPMILITGPEGSGTHILIKTLAKSNGLNYLPIDCNALQSSTAKQTESKISATLQKAKAASPVIVALDNFEVFAVDAENDEDCRIIEYFVNSLTELYQNYTKHTIIFTALTERSELKPNILRIFLDKFHIPKLNAQQRYEMLEWFVSVMGIDIDNEEISQLVSKTSDVLPTYAKDVLKRVAAKTETFLYGDLDTLIHFALRESYLKQLKHDNNVTEVHTKNVEEDDLNNALESMRSLQSHHLDAPKIPKVYWEDIGGLDKLKKELLKTIEFPIKYPHLFKNSTLKRSGILLYGPPGCGKTLVAKAVSTELNVSFLSVKGPELLNMYIGQSEENVRKVFESARASSPCIVFLDELDALAPRRGAAGDSGGASDRLVSQLLAELDGVTTADDADTSSFVFVMGATNRPDLLEQSLLRPGRLDKMIYVGPYSGVQEKTSVLTALCRSHRVSREVDLQSVAECLPPECTGADLLAVVSGARAAALRNTVQQLNTGAIKESELGPDSVLIGPSEMWEGVKQFRPSVTQEELAYYTSLQNTM